MDQQTKNDLRSLINVVLLWIISGVAGVSYHTTKLIYALAALALRLDYHTGKLIHALATPSLVFSEWLIQKGQEIVDSDPDLRAMSKELDEDKTEDE